MKRSLRLYETWPNKPTLNIRALFNWGPVLSRGVFFFRKWHYWSDVRDDTTWVFPKDYLFLFEHFQV